MTKIRKSDNVLMVILLILTVASMIMGVVVTLVGYLYVNYIK